MTAAGARTGAVHRFDGAVGVAADVDREAALVRVPLRWAVRISVLAVAAVLAVALVAPTVWERWPWLPFAVGLLAGLPHGALDHLVPWWTGRTARDPRRVAGVLLAYVALAVATFAVARLWPVPALVVLLLGSVVHFGLGETEVDALRRRGRHGRRARPDRPRRAGLRWAGYGTATVVLPFVRWPDEIRPVLDVLAPGSAAVVLHPAVLVVAAAVTAVAVLATLAVDVVGRRWSSAGELALLTALFALAPPLAAFGVYFGAWHGLRHLARLVAAAPANAADLRAGRLARPVGRLAAHAALPTGAVLAALGVLLAVPGLGGAALAGLVPAGLALVLALTVPHMVVVAVLDRRQRPASPSDGERITP